MSDRSQNDQTHVMENVLTLKIGLLVKSHYGVNLKTRTRAVECYQAISIVNKLNSRLDDL